MIKDLATGAVSSTTGTFVAIGDRVFFEAVHEELGSELWMSVISSLPELPGDFDGDGAVDAADLSAWKDEFSQTGAALNADGDADNDVDGRDFLLWQRNFGRSSSSSSTIIEMVSAPTASATAQDVPTKLEPALPKDGATLLGLTSAVAISDAPTSRKTRAVFREAVPSAAWRAYGSNAPAMTAWTTSIATQRDDAAASLAIDMALVDWSADVAANLADSGWIATKVL